MLQFCPQLTKTALFCSKIDLPIVPPPPISQRHRKLKAAAELFQQQGYPATRVRMIAASVDLGVSTLYNHIKGKQELLYEICFNRAERFELGKSDLQDLTKDSSALLKGVIRLHVRLAIKHPETVTCFNDEWRHLEELELQRFLRKRKDYQHKVTAIMKNGQQYGSLALQNLYIALLTLHGSLSSIYQRKGLSANQISPISNHLYTLWARGWQLD